MGARRGSGHSTPISLSVDRHTDPVAIKRPRTVTAHTSKIHSKSPSRDGRTGEDVRRIEGMCTDIPTEIRKMETEELEVSVTALEIQSTDIVRHLQNSTIGKRELARGIIVSEDVIRRLEADKLGFQMEHCDLRNEVHGPTEMGTTALTNFEQAQNERQSNIDARSEERGKLQARYAEAESFNYELKEKV